MKNNPIKEDAGTPVTTTDNGGQGLTDPKLPIDKKNIFKRYKDLKKLNSDNIK